MDGLAAVAVADGTVVAAAVDGKEDGAAVVVVADGAVAAAAVVRKQFNFPNLLPSPLSFFLRSSSLFFASVRSSILKREYRSNVVDFFIISFLSLFPFFFLVSISLSILKRERKRFGLVTNVLKACSLFICSVLLL